MSCVARLSVDQYHRMIEAGVLRCGDPIELIEGLLIEKVKPSPPVASTIMRVHKVLAKRLPEKWGIRIRSAITTSDSEPEPDLAVVVEPEGRYMTRHPGPKDTALVVEVSETTLEADRSVMGRMYARARIPAYWIVNVPELHLEVYTRPQAGKSPHYRQKQVLSKSDAVSVALGNETIGPLPVACMLPGGPTP
jgi:Uma2 family endonuclease